jgi:ElaA protein
MQIRWLQFESLTPRQLYAIMQLRQRVFVVEQRCAYLDADGKDFGSLLGWGDNKGQLVATARILAPGVSYAEPSIGRVVTAPEGRGTGWGRLLLASALAEVGALYPGCSVRIGAQCYLERFYRAFGFEVASGPYDEDGIPHIEMLRPA